MLLWHDQNEFARNEPLALFQKWKIEQEDQIINTTLSSLIDDLNTSSPELINSVTDQISDLLEIDQSAKNNDSSTDTENSYPLYLKIWATVVITTLLLIGVIGNALVPIIVCKTRELRHSTNIFLLNLAAADFLVMIICLPVALIELHTDPETWVLGATMCRLVPYIEVCVTRASVITLVVISMERWVAICQPLRSPVVCTRPLAAFVCLAIWPFVIVSSVPTIILTVFKVTEGSNKLICTTTVDTISWGTAYHVVCLVFFFFIPFIFLIVIYSLIAYRLLSQHTSSNRRCDNQQWSARKQVVGMLGAVVIVFFLSVLPFQLFTLWIIFVPNNPIFQLGINGYYNILYTCRCLFYLNSVANPIIYNAMSSKFRKALLRFLGMSLSPTGLIRRQSTMTTSSSLSTSSFRRRASSILSHRPIDMFTRRNSVRTVFNKKTESNATQVPANSPPSNLVTKTEFKKSLHKPLNQDSTLPNKIIEPKYRIIPVIKEDLYLEEEELSENLKRPIRCTPSPLSLPSASSSHASTPSPSPLYSMIIENHFERSSSPSLSSDCSKKVSFCDTVFQWDNNDTHGRIPTEDHCLHSWTPTTTTMINRKSKLKNNCHLKNKSSQAFLSIQNGNSINEDYENVSNLTKFKEVTDL